MRIGSLFTGYGGLDMAVETVLGARTVWVADNAPGPQKILAHRFPGMIPNLGDITQVCWATVEPVDIITGGSPCQDVSHAGKRAGMTEGTRSNLWVVMRDAIATIRPSIVVWENVRGAYSATATSDMESDPRLLGDHPTGQPVLRALGRVLGDLASLGYDAVWHGLRAADVGACHGRHRVFVLAWRRGHAAHTVGESRHQRLIAAPGETEGGRALGEFAGRDRTPLSLLPTPTSRDHKDHEIRREPHRPDDTDTLSRALTATLPVSTPVDWGQYTAAVRRQELVFGRPAPDPTEPGVNGRPRLSAEFTSWMMGLPDGWVTDVPGITRNEALTALGNGVVPQQAIAALRWCLAARVQYGIGVAA